MKGQELTVLEQRRVRAARVTILAACAFFVVLAVWQGVVGQGTGSSPTEGWDRSLSPVPQTDPLGIEQAGITFMDANEKMSILWYQSSWNVEQSRALVERSLVLQGWQSLSEDDEAVMSFLYAPSGSAAGGTLIIGLYPLQDGCSVLVELL